MRKVLLLLCLCLLQFSLYAKDKYEVYKVTGTVKVKKSDKWVTLSKGNALLLTDKVQISKGSKLVIVKLPNKMLYESQKAGEMTVGEIKEDAIKQSNESLGLTLRQLYGKNNSGQSSSGEGVHGVTTRGEESVDETFEGVIFINIQNAIANMIAGGKASDNGFDTKWQDMLIANYVTEGTSCYFSITNNTDKLLFVNIVCINRNTNSVSLLYNEVTHPLGVMVPAGKSLPLNMYKFEECDQCQYFIFGTENSFDVAELCGMVNSVNLSTMTRSSEDVSSDFKIGKVIIK